MRSSTMFILFLIFLAVNMLDAVTAYFILPAESNPLVNYMGYFPSLLIKLILVPLIVYYFFIRPSKSSNKNRFYSISVILLAIFLFGLGAYSNISGILDDEIVQRGSEVSVAEKTSLYFKSVLIIALPLMLFANICFWIYERDRKMDKKREYEECLWDTER